MRSRHHSRGVASPSIGLDWETICGAIFVPNPGNCDLLWGAALARPRIKDASCVNDYGDDCAGFALVLLIKE